MGIIELWNGPTKGLVDLEGAWLTNLSDDRGDILFPKRLLTAPDGTRKARGGCHVCLPNFGPGGDSGLPQHGFGRTSLWKVTAQDASSVQLLLIGGAEGYEGLRSVLTYEVGEASVAMTLTLTNEGEAPLRVGPAFHPYFALWDDEDRVKVDGQAIELEELAGTLFEEGMEKELASHRRHLKLTSDNLSTWALWTDRLAAYVCVEPTFSGYTFLDVTPPREELLASRASQGHRFTITW